MQANEINTNKDVAGAGSGGAGGAGGYALPVAAQQNYPQSQAIGVPECCGLYSLKEHGVDIDTRIRIAYMLFYILPLVFTLLVHWALPDVFIDLFDTVIDCSVEAGVDMTDEQLGHLKRIRCTRTLPDPGKRPRRCSNLW